MAKTQLTNSFAVGLNKGFVVTKVKKQARPVDRKRRTSERVRSIRKLIKSVAGMTGFEKRLLEMFKTGVSKVEKRAFKLIKRRLGTRRRAAKKRDEFGRIIKNLTKKA